MTKSKSKSSRTPPSWLVTGIVASLAVLYTLFVFLPGQRKAAALKSKKYELLQYVGNTQKTGERIEQARQKHIEVLQTTADWHNHAPNASELARSLSSITQEARQAGVTLQRFDPQPQQPLKTVVQQAINVSLEGDFSQIFDFLNRLESMPHRVWITNLTLSAPAEDGKTLRAEMTLTIFADLAGNSGKVCLTDEQT
jgi:Tfp pilus assembly protein PilO